MGKSKYYLNANHHIRWWIITNLYDYEPLFFFTWLILKARVEIKKNGLNENFEICSFIGPWFSFFSWMSFIGIYQTRKVSHFNLKTILKLPEIWLIV